MLLSELLAIIELQGNDREIFLNSHADQYVKSLGKNVYQRGLIELSNYCQKDCFYCGIRKGNRQSNRYLLSNSDVLNAVDFAIKANLGSIVIQAGEISSKNYVDNVSALLKEISKRSDRKLGITLSLGEQEKEVYQEWYKNGAQRYLLRIESSNRDLFESIHPKDQNHSFERRLDCLQSLKDCGYQTGSGVMIGLPGQSTEDLAKDLLFFKAIDLDMVGMGPFLEHTETPMFEKASQLWPLKKRFDISINMIAALRRLMPDINIAATTALQSIDPYGREIAIKYGANVIMPNITPTENKKNYFLYDNKPFSDESADVCISNLKDRLRAIDRNLVFGEKGISAHFLSRQGILN